MEARVVVPPAGDAVQLASMLGRAFADDPMIRWKLRADVTATEIGTTFEPLVAAHAAVGTLRQIAGGTRRPHGCPRHSPPGSMS